MNGRLLASLALLTTLSGVAGPIGAGQSQETASESTAGRTVGENNQLLLDELGEVHGLNAEQLAAVAAILARSGFAGQGNPAITVHPMSRDQCREKLAAAQVDYRNPTFVEICGDPFMAPLYDPTSEQPTQATACIDQFEFPNIPCAYPVVWVRANEAAQICEAVGKRLCDAHEWESGCAGRLEEPDYRFDLAQGLDDESAVRRMREAHNRAHAADKSWSYGPEYQTGICAATGRKSADCTGGGWKSCGSNTFPSGAYPDCRSPLAVYDLNGNAAEHMSLPLRAEQMSSQGSREYGVTEMKGSWFIFDHYKAHDDWCRWRAPFWHGSRVMDPHSHHNYHLGFRCCKSVQP